MTKSIQVKGIGLVAFLSAIFWIGVPIILLESDYHSGGLAKALVAVYSPEYDGIREFAFYVPLLAFVVFCLLGIVMVLKKDFALDIAFLSVISMALVISVYSSFHGYIPGYFGLMVCATIVWQIYLHKKYSNNEKD